MEILTTIKNNALDREEIVAELEMEKTPSKAETIKMVAEKLKKMEENIIIEKIHSEYGKKTFIISAKAYNTSESKSKFETIPRKVRKKAESEKEKGENK